MTEIDVLRHNHLIDPQLHIWGWEVPVYLFLGGLAAGVMVMSAALDLKVGESRSAFARWMPLLAPIALSFGMLALFLDLEHKLYVWRFYTAFRPTSPMSWGAWILIAIYPATLAFALAGLTADQVERVAARLARLGGAFRAVTAWAAARRRGLMWTNLILGLALGGYTGILLGTLGARALWSSALLGPLFLVSGLSTGAAAMMLFPVNHEEHGLLRRWDLVAIGVEVSLLALFFIGLLTGSAAGREAAGMLLGGAWTALFWSVVVLAGLATPVALELIEGSRRLTPTRVAPILVLIGGFALRWILVAAGQV